MKPLFTSEEVTDDAFFEALAGRLETANVLDCTEWSQGLRYTLRCNGGTFIAIIEVEPHVYPDGSVKLWRHLSVSCLRPPRVPNWAELGYMKDIFLGDEKALLVLPPRGEYVNDHPHVLHLFSGPDQLPDFRSEYEVNGKPSI